MRTKDSTEGILHPLVTHRGSCRFPSDPVRVEAITGMRAMADFLEAHPEVPVRRFERPKFQHSVQRSNAADSIAEVNRLAAVLGVEATWNGDTYTATAYFGSAMLVIFYSGEPEAEVTSDAF